MAMKAIVRVLIVATLVIGSAFPTAAAITLFSAEGEAQHCPSDVVVWLNLPTHIYHWKGMRWSVQIGRRNLKALHQLIPPFTVLAQINAKEAETTTTQRPTTAALKTHFEYSCIMNAASHYHGEDAIDLMPFATKLTH
jgi:hypothetical protein